MGIKAIVWVGRSCVVMMSVGVAACSADAEQPEPAVVGVVESELAVVVDPPAGVNCFALTLRDPGGVETTRMASLEPTMRFRDVPVGAYLATATAYAAANCSNVPLNAPWGTADSTDVIVAKGQGVVITLQLFKVGRIVVNAEFVDTAEVVAADQGPLGAIAASGNRVVWMVASTDLPDGAVVNFVDHDSAGDVPTLLATGQTATADVNIEATSGDVYWTNRSHGPLAFDGSVWRHVAATGIAAPIAAAQPGPVELAASSNAVYWNDEFSNDIRLFVPSTSALSSFIGAQPRSNSIALVPSEAPTRLLWTNIGDGAVRFVNLPSTTPVDVFVPPPGDTHVPVSVAGDDTFAYWTDFDTVAQEARILRAPFAGGPPQVLFPPPGEGPLVLSYNIEVNAAFVYVNSLDGVKRIAKDGSGPLEIIQQGETGGFALTSFGGASYIYWTDNNFGGTVWRARLE